MYAYNIPIMCYLSSFVFKEPVRAYCSGVGSKCELTKIGIPQYVGLRQPSISIILRVNVVCRHACVPGKGCFQPITEKQNFMELFSDKWFKHFNCVRFYCGFIIFMRSQYSLNYRSNL